MTRPYLSLTAALCGAAPATALAGDLGSTFVSVAVPGMVFLMVMAIVGGAFYAGYRENRDRQETLRLAIEKGVALPPGLVEATGGGASPEKDLRTGVRQVFIGLGVGVLLWFVAPFRGVWAVGAMIAIFGVGHLVAWALTRSPQTSRETPSP